MPKKPAASKTVRPFAAGDVEPKKYEPADGRITHATIGRINVELGDNSVNLRLWGWAIGPSATLALAEAEKLHDKLGQAVAALRKRAKPATVSDEDDPYDVG